MLESLFPLAHERYSSLPLLGSSLEGLCDWLQAHGYPSDAIRRRIAGARLLEKLLLRRGVRSLVECTRSDLISCVPKPRRWTAHLAHTLGRSLSQYLGEKGELAVASSTATEALATEFREYLESVRGLAPVTSTKRAGVAGEFLASVKYDNRPRVLEKLKVSAIDQFLVKKGDHLGRVSMTHVAAALRMFLRFLSSTGKVRPGLDAHVESPRCFRDEKVPCALPWEDVLTLLESIDRSTAKGKRDYAIFLLIATYGLRRGEVVRVRIDDVAWRRRQISVPRPKVGTPLLFPLTDEVASALVKYLYDGRRESTSRRLFLGLRAPYRPIGPDAVTDAFHACSAVARISLPSRSGPHSIRHSVAMKLLRNGHSLKTIGDLLGHRSAESTCVYLRLQLDDLRDVALPLPKSPEVES